MFWTSCLHKSDHVINFYLVPPNLDVYMLREYSALIINQSAKVLKVI